MSGGWSGKARRSGSDRRISAAWLVAILAVVAVLVRTHHITTIEIVLFCVIVPSIILHEISHGWVALAFGDDTAKRAGRLTLNPLAHVDLVGTIIVPAIMALSGVGMFGWAKPVPVNPGALRHPRNEGVAVSLAGPATNVVLAALAYGLFRIFNGVDTVTIEGTFGALWAEILFYLGLTNIWLAVFNMVPVPPLDGSVLFERLLPRRWWPAYLRFRPYTMPVLVGLVLVNFLLHPGPLTWLFTHLYSWWAGRLGLQVVG